MEPAASICMAMGAPPPNLNSFPMNRVSVAGWHSIPTVCTCSNVLNANMDRWQNGMKRPYFHVPVPERIPHHNYVLKSRTARENCYRKIEVPRARFGDISGHGYVYNGLPRGWSRIYFYGSSTCPIFRDDVIRNYYFVKAPSVHTGDGDGVVPCIHNVIPANP